jgi:hypothetical protein
MATFYIDPDSATDGVGSEADPFNTWDSVTTAAGNTYLQKRGTTFVGTITLAANGSAKNLIIGAYGEGADPIIAPTGNYGINSGGFGSHIYRDLEIFGGAIAGVYAVGSAIECNNLTIHGADKGILYPPSTAVRNGRQVIGCHIYDCPSGAIRDDHTTGTNIVHTNILIENNLIEDCGPGIYFFANKDGNAYNGVTVRGNTVDGSTGIGIYIRTIAVTYPTLPSAFNQSVIVTNNTVANCEQGGIYLRGTSATGQSHCSRNHVYNCGTGTDTEADTLGGIWTGECRNLTIAYNRIHDIYTPGIDGCGIFDDQQNDGVKIIGNRIWNCYGSAGNTLSGCGIVSYRAENAEITDNLCYLNKNGIAITGEDDRTGGQVVDSNTTVFNVLWGMYIGRPEGSEIASITVRNNCSAYNSTNDPGGNSEDFQIAAEVTACTNDYNAYLTSGISSPHAAGANDITAAPLLSASYRPLQGSPLLSAGTFISYARRDIEGKQRPNPPSIGAFDMATMRIV